jgi:hypothetical protein
VVLGEKLWEGKGKTTGMAVKSVGAEGICTEFTWMAQLKGMGRAKGVDCNVTVTSNSLQGPVGVGDSKGQGIFMTNAGDMGVMKTFGLGKVEAGKSRSVSLMSFMTMSQKLAWMNTLIAVVTTEGDPAWQEEDITVYEWK